MGGGVFDVLSEIQGTMLEGSIVAFKQDTKKVCSQELFSEPHAAYLHVVF